MRGSFFWVVTVLLVLYGELAAHDPFDSRRFRYEYAYYIKTLHNFFALSEHDIVAQLPKKDTEFMPLYLMMSMAKSRSSRQHVDTPKCTDLVREIQGERRRALLQEVAGAGLVGVVTATLFWVCKYV